ncbi:MAG: hypothetical protein ACOYNL_07015 [Rickettsiales bacterium]
MNTAATYSQEQIGGLLDWLKNQPEETQSKILESATLGGFDNQTIAARIHGEQLAAQQATINQQSFNEATLQMGGYDPTVATAVSASAGAGADMEVLLAAQAAAASFAQAASQAVTNGKPLSEVRFDDPTLTQEAKAAIYAQVAAQQGTTPEKIEAKAEEQKKEDMAAIQQGVFGGAAVAAVATTVNPLAGLLAGVTISDELRQMNQTQPQNPLSIAATLPNQQQREQEGWTLGA